MMNIEHRFGPFCEVILDVYAGIHGHDIQCGHTTELSIHGMFININATGVSLDDEIELYIWIDDILYNARAVVVRATSEGIGVLFKHLASETYRALWAITRQDNLMHGLDPVAVSYPIYMD